MMTSRWVLVPFFVMPAPGELVNVSVRSLSLGAPPKELHGRVRRMPQGLYFYGPQGKQPLSDFDDVRLESGAQH